MRAFAKAPSAGPSTRGNGNTFSFGVLAAALACAAAFLGIGAPAAGAATAIDSYAFGPVFGNGEGGNGGLQNVVVDQSTGNIFAGGTNNPYVYVWSADPVSGGTELASVYFGSAGLGTVANVAVDPTNGTIYASESLIAKAVSDGAPTPTYTIDPGFSVPGGEITSPGAMAVDPVSHDLLVADFGSNRVVRLSSADGSVISTFDGSDTTAGAFQGPRSIAVGPTGTIYVVDATSATDPLSGIRVEEFSAAGVSQGTLSLPGGSRPMSVTVSPVTGDVAVLLQRNNQRYIQGFTSGGTRTFSARVTGVIASGYGLAWDGNTNRIYAALGNATVQTFVPAKQPGVDPPTYTTGRNTAHLEAEVAPGGESTTARFEYCPASEACDSYAVSEPENLANPWFRGPDHTGLTATTTIEDDLPLGSNTDWKVRVWAVNENAPGTDNTSETTSFNSPLVAPGVTTGQAASVTDSQAELTGTIDTFGGQTTYHFEFGTTIAYGSEVPLGTEAPAGSNRTPRNVTQFIGGLQPGTTYHYRLVATNGAGETPGDDRTFTTATADELPPARAYEQVTPVDKEGAQISSTQHVQFAPDGSWAAVATQSGTPRDEGVHMFTNLVVHREADNWSDWLHADAPQRVGLVGGAWEASTAAVSADGYHAMVVSNLDLAPGGIDGGGNVYIKDLRTGAYTFVAGAPGNGSYVALANVSSTGRIFTAGAPDFSWVIFRGNGVSLSSGVPPNALYRWSRHEGLSIESQIPDPGDASVEIVAPEFESINQYKLTDPSVSADGSIVAFSAGAVYRRANGVSTAVSVSEITDEAVPAYFDGMSTDGRYVFFHTRFGPLTEDGTAGTDVEGGYRYDAETGDVEFLSTVAVNLPEAFIGISDDGSTAYFYDDSGTVVWRDGNLHSITGLLYLTPGGGTRAYVTQNGRYFAYMIGTTEAYLYDAVTEQSVCVSCPADGSSPGPTRFTQNARYIGNVLPRVVTEEGTMFFDTASPLISADHNGKRDVYAYEHGRLTLISPGDDTFDAIWVGASDGGKDVYFQTDQALVSQDTDRSTDVYDARIGGGFASQNPPPSPAPCVRTECGAVGSDSAASPPVSSQSVTGRTAFRTKRCKKGYVRKTVKGKPRCVKKPKKKAAKRSASHSRTNGK